MRIQSMRFGVSIVVAFVVMIFCQVYSMDLFADDGVCADAGQITVKENDALFKISNAFNVANRVNYLHDDVYCFRFKMDSTAKVKSGFTLQTTDDRDVVIEGLNITPNPPFSGPILTITNNHQGTVYVKGAQLSGNASALLLSGTGPIVVSGATIVGDAARSGACLTIQSPGAVVKGSDISSCDEGVRIEADGAMVGAAVPVEYDADANIIHNNGFGIHVMNGANNRFVFNSIYENFSSVDPTAEGKSSDGIFMEKVLVDALGQPTIELVDEASSQALHCSKNQETGKVDSRWLKFSVRNAGKVIIYAADGKRQGIDYLTECAVAADGKCDIQEFVKSHSIPDDWCGDPKLFAVALFDDGVSTTMYTKDKFLIDGPISSIPSIQVEMPAGVSGMDGATATGEAGGGGGTVSDVVTGAAGAKGCGGGASLLGAAPPPAEWSWLVWMTLALGGIGATRWRRS